MAHTNGLSDTVGDATAQIAHLRAQVEALMKDRVMPAMSDLTGRAEAAVSDAGQVVRDKAGMVSDQVRAQPLIAVVLAAGVGWVVGRLMR